MGSRPVLVVGRQGQLATDLMEAAAGRATSLVALGRPDLDLTDADSLARAVERIEPAAVINAAAYTAVDRAESEPDLAFALNRDGPDHLARLCARHDLPLVHLSTDQVFDGRKVGGYTETDAPNPISTYGLSKLAGERVIAEACPSALIVRVSWVFGPSADNFVKRLIGWTRIRERIAVVSDQRGRPTYAPSLAEALLTLAEIMRRGGPQTARGLLHLAGASVMTRNAQAVAVMDALRARGQPALAIDPIPTRDFPTPAQRPLNAELDVGLAERRYGLRLRTFEEDLEETLDRLIGLRSRA